MSEMTWEDFLQHEEEKEKQRRIKRLAAELKPTTAPAKPTKSKADKKAEQRALRERIMNDAQRSYEERAQKKYELAQPPMAPVAWLVFDRVTGEFFGEATKMRAYQAWAEVNPKKLIGDSLIVVAYNACRCVLKSEWEKAEAEFRKKKMNGKANGT